MVRVESTRENPLLVQIFVRYGNDQIAARFDDAEPILEARFRLLEMLETMARMDEIIGLVLYPFH